MLLAWLAIGLAVVGVATWLHLRFWVAKLSHSVRYAENLRLPTADGSAIELRRVTSPAGGDSVPVLLVHGLAVDHRNLDLNGQCSLARTLCAAGRDVWLLTLRSGRRDLGRGEREAASFSAMATHDVPLAVTEVLRRTGARHLDYVGFSMGGMLLYAALARSVAEHQVRRAVLIGSPGRVLNLSTLGRWLGRHRHRPWLPSVPLGLAARLTAFAAEWLDTPLHAWMVHLANARPGACRQAMVDSVVDIPSGLGRELATWALAGGQVEVDGRAILDGLGHVRVPARFFVGTVDRLGAPRAVTAAYEAWGRLVAVDKQVCYLGRVHGQAQDYGHGDLLLGIRVEVEVFVPIVQFLAADAGSLTNRPPVVGEVSGASLCDPPVIVPHPGHSMEVDA